MPTIVLSSTKGGVGKSTIALALSQVLANRNARVQLIDADPNQPLARWVERAGERCPANIDVVPNVNESTIIDVIDAGASEYPFVIVDLEGSANLTATYAISRADLVLIPMRGKQLDADEAGKVIALIERENKAFKRDIPYRIIFSMTSVIQSREDKHIRAMLSEAKIPVLPYSLMDKAAFSAIFQLGCTVFDLDSGDVANAAGAVKNAEDVAGSVIAALIDEGALERTGEEV